MLKIAGGELLNEAVTSILWRFIIKNEKTTTTTKEIGSSSESSCHFMQNISTVGKLSEKKNHYNQGMKWGLIKCPPGKSFPPKD